MGFWQLQRANEKVTILENWASQQHGQAIEPKNINTQNIINEPQVEFIGSFDTQNYWLQEGKIINGKAGYLVLMRAHTNKGLNILVNRGWVPANPDRSILPTIPTTSNIQYIHGRARIPSQAPMTKESQNPLKTWPHRILEIEVDLMSQQAGVPLSSFIVDLSEDSPSAFLVTKRRLNMTPEKHRGYAFQWFMMAGTLAILWLITNSNIIKLTGLTHNKNNPSE